MTDEKYNLLVDRYGKELIDLISKEMPTYNIDDIDNFLKYQFIGVFNSKEDFAKHHLIKVDDFPEYILPFVNYKRLGDAVSDDYHILWGDDEIYYFYP